LNDREQRIDDLIGAYLAHRRAEGPAADLSGLDDDGQVRARRLLEVLDALADERRELPAFQNDPLAQRLDRGERVGGDVRAARRLPGTDGTKTIRRRARFTTSRAVCGIAAAMTLVVAATTSLVLLDARTPAGAVERGVLTSDCATTFRGSEATAVDDKPHLVVAATWAGEEQKRFEQVLGRFAAKTGINVSLATHGPDADRDLGETLRGLEKEGCAPDVALLPQPGLLTDLARGGLLTPLDDSTKREVSRHYSPAWQELGKVHGVPYGVWFKAANKSVVWYNVNAFARAGIDKPPSDWEGLKEVAAKLLAAGIAPFAVAGAEDDGWVLSDWFENVYLRTAGPADYDQLAAGQLRWSDPTVKGALARLAEIFGREEWLAGGAAGSLKLTYEDSVRKVFGNPGAPEAAMVFEGDFVADVVATTDSRIGVDARFFSFPSIGRLDPTVVGTGVPGGPGEAGGDVAVLMTATDAGRRLLRYLATPAAAEPWVKMGGFVSPNRSVDIDDYPEPAIRQAAAELVQSDTLRFDLSDLVAPAFGSNPGGGMWMVLRDFLAMPGNIDGTAQRLQEEYEAAMRERH
jgi:alpha-glucoside transport system substrate-binding protein